MKIRSAVIEIFFAYRRADNANLMVAPQECCDAGCVRNSGEVPGIPATPVRNEGREMYEVHEVKVQ
jgi:hypothetical protein